MFSQQRNELIRQRLRQLQQIYEERRKPTEVKKTAPVRKSGLWKPIVDYEDPNLVNVGDRVIVKEKYQGELILSGSPYNGRGIGYLDRLNRHLERDIYIRP